MQRIIANAQARFHKSPVGLLNETINPLWNIDERRAQMIFDFARSGNYAWLQYIYNEIEERDPTLLVCVTRRTSSLAELDWRVVRANSKLYRKADENLVKEQIQCVEEAVAKVDNLPDALEHLALSAFRGYSMIAPIHNASGDVKHFDLIDSWNLCYDKGGQSWYFNPSGSAFSLPGNIGLSNGYIPKELQYIPPDQVCVVTRSRPIDWPALMIYLRAAVGERDWGRYLETYGLPPVIITMPEFTSKEDEDLYVAAAESVFEGRSGVVPYGSQVNYASESRGTNPFTDFIEHQMKLIVLMSTGGTLASLAESGSGTLAGDAQQDEWLRIIRADKRIVSNCLNKQFCEQIIRQHKDFKGKPILAEFQLDSDPQPTAKEIAELASILSSAGYEMDAEEISQVVGFTVRKKQEGGMGFNAKTPPNDTPPTDCGSSLVDTGVVTQAGPIGEVVHKAENASPASIVGKLAKIESRQPGASRQYWDKLSITDRDAALLHLIRQLPKGRQYTKDQVMDFIADKVGMLAALTFSVRWEQLFNTLSDKEGGRFHALTTHGLQVIDVLNTDTAADAPKTPSTGILEPRGISTPPKEETRPAPSMAAAEKADEVTPQAEAIGERLVKSLQTDFKGVADELAKVLALPEEKRAGGAAELLAKIDKLVPNDPAMAEVIEEQMRAAFKEQISREPEGDAPAANRAIPNAKGG